MKYIISFLSIVLVLLSFLYVNELKNCQSLETENINLINSNKELIESISVQNKRIEELSKDSKTFSQKVEEINKSLMSFDYEEINSISIEKDISAEEAITWLKSQASSF